MNQAPLDPDVGPDFSQSPNNLTVAINSKALWTRPVSSQAIEESPQLRFRALGHAVSPGNNRMALRIHCSNKSIWTAEKGAVQNKMLGLSKVRHRIRRSLFQVRVDHPVKLLRAMPALFRQLPHRVAFHNPTPEPFSLIDLSGLIIVPRKRALAAQAEPPLSAVSVMTVSLDAGRRAIKAPFFWPSYRPLSNLFLY